MLRHRQHRLGRRRRRPRRTSLLTAGAPDANGRAVLTLTSPVVIGDKKATSFANGYACWRLRQDPAFATVADSFVDCDGGTRTNVTYSVNSNGSGAASAPVLTIDTAADGAAPAGAGIIRILMQSSETGERQQQLRHRQLGGRARSVDRDRDRAGDDDHHQHAPGRHRHREPARQPVQLRHLERQRRAASRFPSTASTSPFRSAGRRTRPTSSACRTDAKEWSPPCS